MTSSSTTSAAASDSAPDPTAGSDVRDASQGALELESESASEQGAGSRAEGRSGRSRKVLDPPKVMPSAVDKAGLRREFRRQVGILGEKRRQRAGWLALVGQALNAALAFVWTLLPGRLIMHYFFHGGPLMAAGLSYNMLFASTAVLVISASVAGRVLGNDSELRSLVVDAVDETVPGLINTGGGGVIPETILANPQPFTLTTIIATLVLCFVAWRWAAGIRLSCRRMFEVPPARGAPIAAIPRDILGLILLVTVLAVSLVLNAEAAGALRLFEGATEDIAWLNTLVHFLGGGFFFGAATMLGVAADALMLYLMVRGVAQLRPGRWPMTCILLVGVTGNMALREVGSALIQTMAANPYLLSVGIIVGVLFWFYFFSQIILVATAFGALVQADLHGGHAPPRGEDRAVTPVDANLLDRIRSHERTL